jgi:hypothetical protein
VITIDYVLNQNIIILQIERSSAEGKKASKYKKLTFNFYSFFFAPIKAILGPNWVNNAFPFWVILRSKNDLSEITR